MANSRMGDPLAVTVADTDGTGTQFTATDIKCNRVELINDSATAANIAHVGIVATNCIIPIYPGDSYVMTVENLNEIYYLKVGTDPLVAVPYHLV